MSLIALPSYESGLSGEAVLGATPIAGNIASAAEDFGSGNIAAGVIDVAGAALDTVSMILNPIATLASSCASFLMDYMGPLHQELELLTGSPEMVRALAETWDNLGNALTEVASERDSTVQALLASWEGPASRAYEATANGVTAIVRSLAESCHGNAGGLRMAATVVQVVYEIVKGIIADLVGQLIQAVVEALATLGIGIPAIIGQCTSKIATRVPQVARWVEKIQEVMKRIDDAVSKLTLLTQKLEVEVSVVDDVLGTVATAPPKLIEIGLVDLTSIIQGINSAAGDYNEGAA